MPSPARAAEPVAESVRDRLLRATAELTGERGWSDLTMSMVAGRAGVSRQTLYNEFGAKSALGQAMVLRELDRFLAVVESELDGSTDLVDSIRSVCEHIFAMAAENPLLHAVLSTAHGTSNDLLPYLTTQSEPLLLAATTLLTEQVRRNYGDLGLEPDELDVALESVVRLVLSHVMRPTAEPARNAEAIAWLAARLLRR